MQLFQNSASRLYVRISRSEGIRVVFRLIIIRNISVCSETILPILLLKISIDGDWEQILQAFKSGEQGTSRVLH